MVVRLLPLFQFALVLLVSTGCSTAAQPVVSGPTSADVAAVPAGQKRCLVLTTNDSEAHFDGDRLPGSPPQFLGTVSRVAAAKQRAVAVRQQGSDPGVLLVEGGDVLQGRYLDRRDRDRALAAKLAWQIYDHAGYDYGSLGNHEFDNGPKVLRQALQGLLRYRILAANLDGKGTDFDPEEPGRPSGLYGKTALVQCGGIKIGLVGLLTPSTRTISQLGNVRFTDPEDPVVAPAKRAVAALQADGAQVIVALTHLGVGEDAELARAVPELDAIVGGHSHTPLHRWRQEGKTLITQAGARFAFLGRLDLVLDGDGQGLDLTQTRWQLQPITAALPHEPTIEAQVSALRAELEPEIIVGKRTWDWDVTRADGRYGRAVTEWVAVWASRWLGRKVDVALLNAGGFRSQTVYPAGPVTNLEVAAIHPFRNYMAAVELSAAQLRDVAEHACKPDSDRHGQNLIAYGLQWRCDRTQPAVTYVEHNNKPVTVKTRGQRVVDLRLHGQPLTDADPRTFLVATIDYLQRGGSGFVTLSEGKLTLPNGKPPVLMQDMVLQGVQSGDLDGLGRP